MHSDIFHILSSLEIPYQIQEHRAIFSEKDGADVEITLPGVMVKNLFVQNKCKYYALIVLELYRRADLKKIAVQLGCGRLSFCSPVKLAEILHISPGSVSPLCIMSDTEHRVKVLLDRNLVGKNVIIHPLRNTASISISFDDLKKFIRHFGCEFQTIDVCCE